MKEVAAKRLFIEEIQRKGLLNQKRRRELLHVEGQHLLGGMVLIDQGRKAGEEIRFAVAEVSAENTLIELVEAPLCLYLAVVDVCDFRGLLVEQRKIGIRREQRWKKIHFSPGTN